jgi:hypothetical protein
MRRLLAIGGILVALAYLESLAIQSRPRWGAYRRAAKVEEMEARVEAKLASNADGRAKQLRREGRISKAEQLAKEAEEHRQREALHQRASQEFLGRWW